MPGRGNPPGVGPSPEARTAGARTVRFNAAMRRVKEIVDGLPALTAEQREKLALILAPDLKRDDRQASA